jgi:hypothetical protein
MDYDDIETEAVNGSWVFDFITNLNRSNNASTSHHRGGQREIDFIFGDAPMKNEPVLIGDARNLSDHDLICTSIQASTI